MSHKIKNIVAVELSEDVLDNIAGGLATISDQDKTSHPVPDPYFGPHIPSPKLEFPGFGSIPSIPPVKLDLPPISLTENYSY
jgi:hypothetical protein